MIPLATIRFNHLFIECGCGHKSVVPVAELLKRLSREADVHSVVASARCTQCGKKGGGDFRIIHICDASQIAPDKKSSASF